jgi:hypothetical protein
VSLYGNNRVSYSLPFIEIMSSAFNNNLNVSIRCALSSRSSLNIIRSIHYPLLGGLYSKDSDRRFAWRVDLLKYRLIHANVALVGSLTYRGYSAVQSPTSIHEAG